MEVKCRQDSQSWSLVGWTLLISVFWLVARLGNTTMDFQDSLLHIPLKGKWEEINGINIHHNPPPPGKSLTLEEAKEALKKLIENFEKEENDKEMRVYFKRMIDIHEGDWATGMHIIRPIGFDIQKQVLPELGYEASYVGLVQLGSEIRKYFSDPEVRKLRKKLGEKFVPHRFRQKLPE